MKKAELFPLFHGLKDVSQFPGVKFAYAVAKNMAAVKTECECLEKSAAASDEFMEYDRKRVELGKELCDMNEDGSPATKTSNGQEVFMFDGRLTSPAWEAAITALNAENAEVIAARTAQLDDFNKLLDEDTDVVLFKVSADQLPEGINAAQISTIISIIEN